MADAQQQPAEAFVAAAPAAFSVGDKVFVPHVDKYYEAKILKCEFRFVDAKEARGDLRPTWWASRSSFVLVGAVASLRPPWGASAATKALPEHAMPAPTAGCAMLGLAVWRCVLTNPAYMRPAATAEARPAGTTSSTTMDGTKSSMNGLRSLEWSAPLKPKLPG